MNAKLALRFHSHSSVTQDCCINCMDPGANSTLENIYSFPSTLGYFFRVRCYYRVRDVTTNL